VLTSLLSSALSLIFPLIERFYLLSVAFKILEGLLLTLLCTNFKGIKDCAVFYSLFLLLTFLTGGAIMGVTLAFKIKTSSELFSALIFIPAYFFIKFSVSAIKYLYKRKTYVNLLYNLEIVKAGKKINALGFLDTGNGLYYKNKPVIIIDKKTAFKFLDVNFFKSPQKLTAHSVGADFDLNVFLIDELKVYFNKKPSIFSNVWVAISSSKLDAEYSVILHPDLTEGFSDDKNFSKIKKTS
jgi:hypothetical protein